MMMEMVCQMKATLSQTTHPAPKIPMVMDLMTSKMIVPTQQEIRLLIVTPAQILMVTDIQTQHFQLEMNRAITVQMVLMHFHSIQHNGVTVTAMDMETTPPEPNLTLALALKGTPM